MVSSVCEKMARDLSPIYPGKRVSPALCGLLIELMHVLASLTRLVSHMSLLERSCHQSQTNRFEIVARGGDGSVTHGPVCDPVLYL